MHALSRARNAPAGMRLKNATQLRISGEIRAGICGCAVIRRMSVEHGGIRNADAIGAELPRLRPDDLRRKRHTAT